MSLLDQFKERFCFMDKIRTSDGEGGYTVSWTEGAEIEMSLRHDNTLETIKAESEGVTSTYTFFAQKGVSIEYHDVLKRKRDGQVFRITGTANENITPGSATLNLTAITAEKWELS